MNDRLRRATTMGAILPALLLVTSAATAGSGSRQEEARVELGRRLFFDPVASRGGQFSCAACHDPEHGFSDPRQFSVDENGTTARHSQPVVDLAGDGFHWDGEFDTVRQLLVARLGTAQAALVQTVDLLDARFAAAERATDSPDRPTFERKRSIVRPPYYGDGGLSPTSPVSTPPVVARLDIDGRYDDGFRRAFGSADITPDRVVDAMESYLGTLRTAESAWDLHRRGQTTALSDSARRGLDLFRGKAGCNSCHVTKGRAGRNLSDGTFHDTGVAFRAPPPADLVSIAPLGQIPFATPLDAGRSGQTFVPNEAGRFKTPSLRDIALRAPYMHDGSLATLRDVVDYYDRGCTTHEGLDPKIRPLGLDEDEKHDLVCFLESLTGEERAGLGDAPTYRGATTRVRLLAPDGRPIEGLTVTVTPAGDRLRDVDTLPAPFDVTSDRWGWIEFAFPLSTQVRLDSDSHEIAMGRLVPDWSRKLEVVAAPRDALTVTVRRANPETTLPASLDVRPVLADGATSDAVITLARARRVNADVSIYSAPRDDSVDALARRAAAAGGVVDVAVTVPGERAARFPLDLTGGHSEPFDLRVDSTRALSTGSTSPEERRRRGPGAGGMKPPTPRADPGRPSITGVKPLDPTSR